MRSFVTPSGIFTKGVHDEQVEEFEVLRALVQVHGKSLVGWAFRLCRIF